MRISDARMSGCLPGTCVLHVAPESHVGGPLALVREETKSSSMFRIGAWNSRVDERELSRRRAAWRQPQPPYGRGYGAIFARHATQANEGCDFDFLAQGPSCPRTRSTDPQRVARVVSVSRDYQGTEAAVWKKPRWGPLFGSVAAQTRASAPSSTERVAPEPPMSVCTTRDLPR